MLSGIKIKPGDENVLYISGAVESDLSMQIWFYLGGEAGTICIFENFCVSGQLWPWM